jgi:hypothetical protein
MEIEIRDILATLTGLGVVGLFAPRLAWLVAGILALYMNMKIGGAL